MPYTIYKSDNTLLLTIEDGQLNSANTSLTLVGKNVVNYGQYENTSLVHLLENFAKQTPPANPLEGQLWFDKTADVLKVKVFDGSSWNPLPALVRSSSEPALRPGDFWWNTATQELYIRDDSSNVLLGGTNVAVAAAERLATARTINGVAFDGTANITISSTVTNALIFGNYLVSGSFNGSVPSTVTVDVGTVNSPVPQKVVARDNSGDIWFNVGHGVATASRYADLAEKYLADKKYDIGTVVSIGGEAEVTACAEGDRAIGVVSQNPALMMNSELPGGTYIALKGRVPVKVTGTVKKKQFLIAGPNGTAIGVNENSLNVFAIALESNEHAELVEAFIL